MINVRDDLIESIKRHEGFRGDVYKDHLGNDTVGFGTLMPLSEKEAKVLLIMRLEPMIKELQKKKPYFKQLPSEVQDVLIEMAYQMGVNGLMGFKNMWAFISEFEFIKASVEMLDSKWYRQMHEADMLDGKDSENRAERLSKRMKAAEV